LCAAFRLHVWRPYPRRLATTLGEIAQHPASPIRLEEPEVMTGDTVLSALQTARWTPFLLAMKQGDRHLSGRACRRRAKLAAQKYGEKPCEGQVIGPLQPASSCCHRAWHHARPDICSPESAAAHMQSRLSRKANIRDSPNISAGFIQPSETRATAIKLPIICLCAVGWFTFLDK
jgi:hypothetical protein